LSLALLPSLALALLAGGCGNAVPRSRAVSPARTQALLRDSPPPLASLHRQANQLLGGGRSAFSARLQALRGEPLVINKWASWCGPCQREFPVFQTVSLQLGHRVGFLGLDWKDANQAAAAFLRRYPISYPSYEDPDSSLATLVGAGFAGAPQTVFLDRRGHVAYVHAGPYLQDSALVRDVRFYLLKGD
jgi:thiol-disulfide isomerase/thioredoxin